MTHHDKDLNLDELAKKEGLKSSKVIDYSEVDQGSDSNPSLTALNTIEADVPKAKKEKKAKGGKKGRGNTAPGEGPRRPTAREQMRCSNCLNPMTQSKNVNYQDIPGKKAPKNPDTGKPIYKSPNAKEGKLQGVLCDDCLRNAEEGKPVYVTTAVVEGTDGTITNVPVASLPNA